MDNELRYSFTGDTSSLAHATDQALSLLDSYEQKFQEVAAAGNVNVSHTVFEQYANQLDRLQDQLLEAGEMLHNMPSVNLQDIPDVTDLYGSALDDMKALLSYTSNTEFVSDEDMQVFAMVLQDASSKLHDFNTDLATLGVNAKSAADSVAGIKYVDSNQAALTAQVQGLNAVRNSATGAASALKKVAIPKTAKDSIDSVATAAEHMQRTLRAAAGSALPIEDMMDEVGDEASGAAGEVDGAAVSLTNLGKSAQEVGQHIMQALGSIGKISMGVLTAPFRSVDNILQKLFKPIQKFGHMLMFTFNRLIRYKLVSAIFKDVAEAMKQFAEANIHVKQILDGANTSIKNMTANIAAALVSALQAVLPMLEWLAAKVIMVANAIALLFARLSGASSYFKASTADLYEYGEAAGGAGGAAEDLKNAISGLDELNIISPPGTGGGAGGGGDFGENLEEVPVEKWDLLEKLRQYIEDGDWAGLGAFLGEKLNEVVQQGLDLDWVAIQSWVNGWVINLTDALNSFTEAVNWENIGRLLANGINTALYAFKTFVDTYDFGLIGESLAQGINGFFEDFDWAVLGQSISGWAVGLLDSISSFLEELDWTAVGNSIALTIEGVDWTAVTAALGDALSGALGGSLDLVNGFLAGVDWGGTIQEIIDGVVLAIENFDWQGVAPKIAEALGRGLVVAFQMDKLASFLKNPVGTLVGLIAGELANAAAEQDFSGAGENTIAGFFKGIDEALATLRTWVMDTIINPFVGAIEEGLGIHSPSTVMMEIGRNTITGLVQGMLSQLSAIISGASSIWNTITAVFTAKSNSLRTTMSGLWAGVGSMLSGVFSSIWRSIEEFISRIAGGVQSIINTIGELINLDAKTSTTSSPNKAKPTLPKLGGMLGVTPFAVGGVVSQPTLSLLGEKYKEGVIPLEDSPEMKDLINKVARAATGAAGGTGAVDVKVIIGGRDWDTNVYESYERGKKLVGARPIMVGG